MGKKVLRPGGRALSDWMLTRANLGHARVVELAPDLGIAATQIPRYLPQSTIGIDRDADAARQTSQRLRRQSDAATMIGDPQDWACNPRIWTMSSKPTPSARCPR
ncbi:hypothetical protein [Corynebacterium pelargi]|uniref:Uncharacterized protein n=1 Tax=Corynebacterium pelargi TaxID=1471400 RepID=A0A410WB15_9CORY|nr:hypothetical protein [Corynebacterium pelargi]QAU53130.1 hypothetical protein CPELA_09375 [Corynebacterium pelargi]GGG74687.1 hypothetical protein GCM10007338_10090 [Corynebacterium pelargi]